ncbi:hypothetical protein [Eubacterium oxidoreducens]|uniref:Type II secretory pathway, pseudopilin PulG n=1 Tax=Eubacterium oxidoreducens TaxID=1732 RepID=A0A1G6BLL7_EUBOX|nr:hypothetical protein [Eubacterium oxidoreducens]SDB21484.1 hypothetical protein SAMN02910417_01607 [Eubacterium oxidoreducens]
MKGQNRNASVFSYGLEMIILVFIFLLVAGVLIQVYGGSITESGKAQMLQDGVRICQNAAEVYASSADMEEVAAFFEAESKVAEGTIWLDADTKAVTSSTDAKYKLVYDSSQVQTGLWQAHFQVYTTSGDLVYELTTMKYIPEVSADER